MESTLNRKTFTTDRTLEFFSEKELSMQIGHHLSWWPAALVKELIDNSLDACETAGILPEIKITVEQNSVSVQDNGHGLPAETIEKSLNYLVRVSDKNHYISPSRGQLGNALKCVYAAPFVLDGERGRVEIITGGKKHIIDVTLDRIAQRPKLEHTINDGGFVKNGTFLKIYIPEIASIQRAESYKFNNSPPEISELINAYCVFNPHATFIYNEQEYNKQTERTTEHLKKWYPNYPTSAHWYSPDRLSGLIGAYISLERKNGSSKSVREFVSEFRGLTNSGKQKKVVEAADLPRAMLDDLVEDGRINPELVKALLSAMRKQSKPVNPPILGTIGEDHIKAWMIQKHVAEDSIRYKLLKGVADGMPYVLEMAFGVLAENFTECGREITAGLNWSPALKLPFPEIETYLSNARAHDYDPVRVVVHLVYPKLDFTDRGKSSLQLPEEIKEALQKGIKAVTTVWTLAKRKADKDGRIQNRQLEQMWKRQRQAQVSATDAADQVMQEAYMEASNDGKMPANARQIMYAARGKIIELTGKTQPWKDSRYFTQTLLPDFLKNNPELTKKWDVVYDARGKLVEPHTKQRVDLGTLSVRRYIAGWTNGNFIAEDIPSIRLAHCIKTKGPRNRYNFVLFVEKEGFNELFSSVSLAERYDMAIMSTKGMSVTAARQLVAELTTQGVTVLVLRDFDKSGFSIVSTLSGDTNRYQYKKQPNVIDLGLRLEDVLAMDLKSEDVKYDSKKDPRINLLKSGATEAEANFLVNAGCSGSWKGKRVELNAMNSAQLVKWLESKLEEVGVKKVIPDIKVLESAYRNAHKIAYVENAAQKAINSYSGNNVTMPDNLQYIVKEKLNKTRSSWDEIVSEIAERTNEKVLTR